MISLTKAGKYAAPRKFAASTDARGIRVARRTKVSTIGPPEADDEGTPSILRHELLEYAHFLEVWTQWLRVSFFLS
jgi:hypothetical protein